MDTKAKDIDHYIAGYPDEVREILEKVRATIHKAAPDAEESINYGIPTFKLHGNLVHFGGFKQHIGFYPAPSGIKAFEEELSKYPGAKGSIQFPLDKPIPYTLITKIVKYRVKENMEKQKGKSKKISDKEILVRFIQTIIPIPRPKVEEIDVGIEIGNSTNTRLPPFVAIHPYGE